jgi:ComF family protein
MLTGLAERFPLFKGLIDFVYPPLCAGCGSYAENPQCICDRCLERIDWWDSVIPLTDIDYTPQGQVDEGRPRSFPAFVAASYVDPLRQIIIQYKFRGAVAIAPAIAERLCSQFGAKIKKLEPAVIVPIPLHPSREYERGYNQAKVFAEQVSHLLDIPMDNDLLVRVRKGKPQSRLGKSKRVANIRSVFALAPGVDPAEKCQQVILVDDVITSGQTVFEARRTLREAGIEVVGAIAMAHRL